MDCVVTAGGVPDPDDPLYPYTQGKPKACIPIGDRTVLERVIDALQTSQYVDRIVVVGLGSDMGMQFLRPVDKHLPDQGGMVANTLAGIRWLRETDPGTDTVLFCSGDVPAVTGAAIDTFIDLCRPFDKGIYYIMVTRETMEARFPASNRTYVKLAGAEIAGGDVVIAHADLADDHELLWQSLTNARKHAWKLARVVGFRFLVKLLFKRLSIGDIEQKAEEIIGRPSQIVLDPPAELAMDVDKPQQVELLRQEVASGEIL